MEANPALDDFALALAPRGRPPKIAFVPTACGDSADYIARFRAAFPPARAETSVLGLFDRTIADLSAFLRGQDIVYVGGGSTPNLLAVWRAHQLDVAMVEALDSGVVMVGISAGLNCWFDASVTDAFAGVGPLNDGLGVLAGSGCPHYHGDAGYRAAYLTLIAQGQLPAGHAADDSCGLLFEDGVLADVVASVDTAAAYRVAREGDRAVEQHLDARLLTNAE